MKIKNRRKAFTIAELIIAIVVLMIISAVAIIAVLVVMALIKYVNTAALPINNNVRYIVSQPPLRSEQCTLCCIGEATQT